MSFNLTAVHIEKKRRKREKTRKGDNLIPKSIVIYRTKEKCTYSLAALI